MDVGQSMLNVVDEDSIRRFRGVVLSKTPKEDDNQP